MTHSLIGADRGTHVKIVAVALVAATLMVVVGITARVAGSDPATAAVLKAGKPTMSATTDARIIR